MKSIEIFFGIHLTDYELYGFLRRNGPTFHRWLPNGKQDAIEINFPKEKARLKLWHERRGFVDRNGYIVYDHERKDVDGEYIGRQAVLEAGTLLGTVFMDSIPNAEFESIVRDEIGTKNYEKIASKIVKNIIDPVIDNYISILRDSYGQYWVPVYEKFDSRKRSIGSHCRHLSMSWYDRDRTSHPFQPNKFDQSINIDLENRTYDEYLSKKDWENIGRLVQERYTPPLAASIASRANKLNGEGRYSHALIESVTALEVALDQHIRASIGKSKKLQTSIQSIAGATLPARLTLVASLAGVKSSEIELALAAIIERNKVVHDGYEADDQTADGVLAILNIIKILFSSEVIRFPQPNTGNELRAKESDWDI